MLQALCDQHQNDEDHLPPDINDVRVSMPMLAGLEASLVTRSQTGARPAWKLDTNREHAHWRNQPREVKGTPLKSNLPERQMEGGVSEQEIHSAIETPPIIPGDMPISGSEKTTRIEEGDDLMDWIRDRTHHVDIFEAVRKGYEHDPVFKRILEAPSQFKNFEKKNNLLYLKEKGYQLLCIPADMIINGRSLREIFISEAHSLLAHLSSVKTLAYLRDHVWWKSMSEDVRRFCETCITCRRSKPNNQKPYGLLNSLDVPSEAWEVIGVDFVGPLPESSDRDGSYNAITTIIDLLTGMVHLVPSRINYNAYQVAELMFAEVYRLHGLPKRIISDRDVLFTSRFWQRLNQLIGVNTHLSSAYHPESDGSTERANRTITQMIRNCISEDQTDWVQHVPAIEFAINISCSESMGYAPFFLNTGRIPRTMVWNSPMDNQYPGVTEFAERIKHALIAAHDSIIAARVKQTRNANRKRQPAKFEEGDLVYISTENMSIKKERARKLAPKYIGPYRILKNYNND